MRSLSLVAVALLVAACAYAGSPSSPSATSVPVTDATVAPSVAPTFAPVATQPATPSSQAIAEASATPPQATPSDDNGCGPSDPPDMGPRTGDVSGGWGGGPAAPLTIADLGEASSDQDAKAAWQPLLLPKQIPSDLTHERVILQTSGSYPGVEIIYGDREIKPTTTLVDYFEGRAIQLGEHETSGQTAELVKQQLGNLAAIVRIGPYEGALTLGSPVGTGYRPYSVYWSDGSVDSFVYGNVEATEVVDMARSLYCH